MKKRDVALFVVALVWISLIGLTSSLVQKGNATDNLNSVYGPNQFFLGWVNLSIQNEYSGKLFKDSLGNSISILDLLRINKEKHNIDFNCSTLNCASDYISSDSFTEREFELMSREEKIIGVRLFGDGISIENVSMSFYSDAIESCTNQLELVFGETAVLKNPSASEEVCERSRSYGCFNETMSNIGGLNLINNAAYCQKINSPEAPAIKVGAWVKNSGGNGNVTFFLVSSQGGSQIPGATCNVGNSELSSEGSEVSCKIDKPVGNEEKIYVCVKTDSTEEGISIRGTSSGEEKCGYFTQKGTAFSSAYQIFVDGLMYAVPGEINLNDTESKTAIAQAFNEYLSLKYGAGNCGSGCTIPIRISSKLAQKVTIKDLSLKYSIQGGLPNPETNFIEVEEIAPNVSTQGFVNLYLDDAEFKVPSSIKKHKVVFSFEGNKLFEKEIEIQDVPEIVRIAPTIVFSSYPTNFTVFVTAKNGTNLTYDWKFSNDEQVKKTTGNFVVHSFNTTGSYYVEVNVTDDLGRASKKAFEIIVKEPDEAINATYTHLNATYHRIETSLNGFNDLIKQRVREILNLNNFSKELEEVWKKKVSADTIEKKNEILMELLNLSLPDDVVGISDLTISLVPKKEMISPEAVHETTGEKYNSSKESGYKDNILIWQLENADVKLKQVSVGTKIGNDTTFLLNYYEASFSKKKSENPSAYIFIKNMGGIKFENAQTFTLTNSSDYYHSSANEKDKVFKFTSTQRESSLSEIPIFLSPSLSKVDPGEDVEDPSGDGPVFGKINWGWLSLAVLGVLFLGMVLYLFLQSWYKNKYETHLFKERNQMYNLITFMEAQKKMGVSDAEIFGKLRKSGWSREQVNYVIRKYLGKRTGMVELPLPNPFDTSPKESVEKPSANSARGFGRPGEGIGRGSIPGRTGGFDGGISKNKREGLGKGGF